MTDGPVVEAAGGAAAAATVVAAAGAGVPSSADAVGADVEVV